MAELADAHGSGPCGGYSMEVRVLFGAPKQLSFEISINMGFQSFFFFKTDIFLVYAVYLQFLIKKYVLILL